MVEKIKLFIKGIIIGTACIIPGVSGGTLMLSLGIYEKLIGIAANPFHKFKENLLYIIPIGLGMIISVLLLSNVISIALEKFEVQTILLFIGLLLGGIPSLLKNTSKKTINGKNLFIGLICFALILIVMLSNGQATNVDLSKVAFGGYILLFLVGILASATMVIPGISGSLVLMLIGYYKPIVNTIKELTHFNDVIHNVLVLIPFGIGILFGIVLISKIIKYFLKKHPVETYYAIYGIILASILCIIIPLSGFTITNVLIGLVLCALGFLGAYKLGN